MLLRGSSASLAYLGLDAVQRRSGMFRNGYLPDSPG